MPASVSRPEETALFLADRCADLEAENERLREQLRWRKTDEEKPENDSFALIILRGMSWPNVIRVNFDYPLESLVVTHWRPIGPLPGGE